MMLFQDWYFPSQELGRLFGSDGRRWEALAADTSAKRHKGSCFGHYT